MKSIFLNFCKFYFNFNFFTFWGMLQNEPFWYNEILIWKWYCFFFEKTFFLLRNCELEQKATLQLQSNKYVSFVRVRKIVATFPSPFRSLGDVLLYICSSVFVTCSQEPLLPWIPYFESGQLIYSSFKRTCE